MNAKLEAAKLFNTTIIQTVETQDGFVTFEKLPAITILRKMIEPNDLPGMEEKYRRIFFIQDLFRHIENLLLASREVGVTPGKLTNDGSGPLTIAELWEKSIKHTIAVAVQHNVADKKFHPHAIGNLTAIKTYYEASARFCAKKSSGTHMNRAAIVSNLGAIMSYQRRGQVPPASLAEDVSEGEIPMFLPSSHHADLESEEGKNLAALFLIPVKDWSDEQIVLANHCTTRMQPLLPVSLIANFGIRDQIKVAGLESCITALQLHQNLIQPPERR